jgi:hypothetical protein
VGALNIGRGHISDNICPKKQILEKLFLQKIKGVIQQQVLEQKVTFKWKIIMSQKVVFIFCQTFACDFFRWRRIFADFKTGFRKVSRTKIF